MYSLTTHRFAPFALAGLLLAFPVAGASAQTTSSGRMGVGASVPATSGQIEIVGGDSHDWGTVAPQKLQAEIRVKNVGTETLRIDTVRPSCGCTVAPIDKKLIEPGEFGTIHVTFDVSARTGPVEKSITVQSSDPKKPYTFVRLIANVRRTVTLTPGPYIIVQDAEPGKSNAAQPITITNSGDQPFTLSPPDSVASNALITFDITEPRELAPGESLVINAMVVPHGKWVQGRYTMKTTNADNPEITLEVSGTVRPPQTEAPKPPISAPTPAMGSH